MSEREAHCPTCWSLFPATRLNVEPMTRCSDGWHTSGPSVESQTVSREQHEAEVRSLKAEIEVWKGLYRQAVGGGR